MKMYILCHNWLSAEQHGIQGTHAVVDMGVEYGGTDGFLDTYLEWATDHKTIIHLKGGNSTNLIKMEERLQKLTKVGIQTYPTIFREDEESLEYATTAVAFLADDKFCKLMEHFLALEPDLRVFEFKKVYGFTDDTIETISIITSMKLA